VKYRKIGFSWSANEELNIESYIIARRIYGNDAFSEVANISHNVTTWTDTSTSDLVWYEYKIQAINSNGNLSPESELIRARHLSFCSGILFVDLTFYGGSIGPLSPPRELVEEFYSNLLVNYSFNIFYPVLDSPIQLRDFDIYSTVIVQKAAFDNRVNEYLVDILMYFIDHGGNLILIANNPLQLLGQVVSYPHEFHAIDFARQYFQIESVNRNNSARLAYAKSTGWSDIPSLIVDTYKPPPPWEGRLRNLEVFNSDGFQTIHTFYSGSESPIENAFDGMPVTLYTKRGDSHIVITSVPLFFMQTDSAKEFMQAVLSIFEEPTSIDDYSILPTLSHDLRIRNFPNPFNPVTAIEFNLAIPDYVSLSIYNIRGQRIRTFTSNAFPAGRNTIIWDGKDNHNNEVSSGIYLFRVQTATGVNGTGRMLLLK
jgi:hypothetical protein